MNNNITDLFVLYPVLESRIEGQLMGSQLTVQYNRPECYFFLYWCLWSKMSEPDKAKKHATHTFHELHRNITVKEHD